MHCILYEEDPVAEIAPLVYATDLSANGTFLRNSNVKCTTSQDPGMLMGQNCTFLLDDGDELRISETVTLIYYSKNPVEEIEMSPVQEREKDVFASRYLVTGRLLGEGGYGKVLVGVHQETQRQLACKIIRLSHMYEKLAVPNLRVPTGGRDPEASGTRQRWPTKVANCFREFDILKELSHPNIVALEKVFWSHNTIYIFQELVTGGDLFSFLEYKNGRLDNIQAAVIIRQILKGVEYLHDQDIVHRDLKPDNILMTSLDDGARVVITDFGNARFLPGSNSSSADGTRKYQRMFSYVGTLEFAAPEIHRANQTIPADEGYSKSVDMWSVGSITATILTGDVIFTDRNHPKYYEDPRAVIISLAAIADLTVLDAEYHPLWSVVGDRPKHFIKSLLVLDEKARLTAPEALAHPWFSCYARDFEDLYARSIEGWEPRQKNTQLVERISKSTPDLSGNSLSHASASRFFPSSQAGPTHNMVQKLSTSQRWRANTPLPSIREDYEAAHFASQVQPPSGQASNADYDDQQGYDVDSYRQCDPQSYGEGNINTNEAQLYDAHSFRRASDFRQRENYIGLPLSEFSLDMAIAPGIYNRNDAATDEDSYRSEESLERVMEDGLGQEYSIQVQQLHTSKEAQESVLVGETPQAEDIDPQKCSNESRQSNESYQQTQFPHEYRQQQAPEAEENSVLVRETPPEVFRKHSRSSDNSLPSYKHWLSQESQANRPDVESEAQKYAKRRRLSNCRH